MPAVVGQALRLPTRHILQAMRVPYSLAAEDLVSRNEQRGVRHHRDFHAGCGARGSNFTKPDARCALSRPRVAWARVLFLPSGRRVRRPGPRVHLCRRSGGADCFHHSPDGP